MGSLRTGTDVRPGSDRAPIGPGSRRTGLSTDRLDGDGDQGVQAFHFLLFAGGMILFAAGFVVVVVGGLPGGGLSPGAANATTSETPTVTSSATTTTPTTADSTATGATTTEPTTTAPTTTTRTSTTATTPTTTTTTPTTRTTSTPTTRTTTTPTTRTTTTPTTRTTTTSTTRTTRTTTTSTTGETVDADVLGFFPQQGSFSEGETVSAKVRFENTGTTKHTFYVGYSVYGPDGVEYNNAGTTGKRVTLAPGQRTTVTVEWVVESDAPVGGYDAQTIIWKETNDTGLETRLDGESVENAFWVEATSEN